MKTLTSFLALRIQCDKIERIVQSNNIVDVIISKDEAKRISKLILNCLEADEEI